MFFFFHSPKCYSTSIQVHKCQHLIFFFLLSVVVFFPGLYSFHSEKYITGYYSVFSNHNYIFCPRIVLEGLDLQLFMVEKYPARLGLLFHCATCVAVQALSDKSISFQPTVTSQTAKQGSNYGSAAGFGTSEKLIQTRASFIPGFFFTNCHQGVSCFVRRV